MAIKLYELARELQTSEEKLRNFGISLKIGVSRDTRKIDRRQLKIIKRAFLDSQEKEISKETRESLKEKKKIEIGEVISVRDLADKMELPATEVIKELMKNKIFITLNEEIDYETAAIISEDLGFKVKQKTAGTEEDVITQKKLQKILEKEDKSKLKPRPPVVVLMGHIDHGKTSLLDAIRKTNTAEKEVGGITQALSFCQVEKKKKLLTFIDTPGHEAFAKMREQGALISDLVILVVAADDSVKPQTKEVINYIQKEKIPFIVAINKADKKEANIDKVKRELAKDNVLCEGLGGETVCLPVSAKTKKGINELIDMVILATEVEKPEANPDQSALGTILESYLDKNKGPVAMAIVQTGAISEGNSLVSGSVFGSVRKMEDFKGRKIEKALPGTPIIIIGFNDIPEVGDVFQVADDKNAARAKAFFLVRKEEARRRGTAIKTSSKNISEKIEEKKTEELPLIIKADKKGSLRAILDILATFKNNEVRPYFLVSEVGDISESDVIRAFKAKAILIGFKVGITQIAKKLAERDKVEVNNFEIIYDLIEYVKKKLEEKLPSIKTILEIGKLKVLKIFMTSKKKMIVGGKVTSGKVVSKCKFRVKRSGQIAGSGIVIQLQQNKKNMEEVKEGNECGISIEGDVKTEEGDTLEFYQEKEERKKLEEIIK